MDEDARILPGEALRQTMRRWVTGVSVVTSAHEGKQHGMTVNSFTSVSLEPPLVTVTLANTTRTQALVQASGLFGVTVLAQEQADLSELFAGKIPEGSDRFQGVETFSLDGQVPLLSGGLAGLSCRVMHAFPMANSTLFVGEVLAAWRREDGEPLVYYNRAYHRMIP